MLGIYYCDKIPEVNQSKGGKIYFGPGFSPLLVGSIALVSVVRQNIIVDPHGGVNLLVGAGK